MRIFALLALGLLFSGLLLFGCLQPGTQTPTGNQMKFTYKITPCSEQQRSETTSYAAQRVGNTILINQTQSYVCCANITMRMEANGSTLRIYQDNVGEYCRCMCSFKADMKIENASNYDAVEIYGIKYANVSGYELMYNWSANAPPPDCLQDSDCVHTPTCCHEGSGSCIAKSKAGPQPDCTGMACTMECRQCTSCVCTNGKCGSTFTDGCC
ncbi:MAG: hypothetical protein V1492_04405 [Candidatus Micrarchaeota archaeon]